MTSTPYHSLPEIATGQSDKSVTHNDGLQILDIITNRGIVDKDLTTPPGSPTDGAAYIVAAGATGAWSGEDGHIAYYRSGWVFVTPKEGYSFWVNDEDLRYTWDGSAWVTSGLVGLASTTEVLTGTNTTKGATPDAIAALWEKGADTASAGTVSLGEGGYFHITGTTTITDIDWATAKDGRHAWVVFDGILTLTHNGSTLKLPGATNITTAAGDRALFVQDNSDNVICLAYVRADGTALVSSGTFTAASTTEALTGTDTSKGVTPDALAALWEKGADEASAGTVSFGEGGFFHITGTTTITDIDWDTAKDGRMAWAVFDGALTLTHNATTLKLPGGANITTAAGDRALFVQDASDNVICLVYIRADGTPLLSTVLQSNVSANLTKGFTSSAFSAGTKSSGTFTPDPANGNLQYYTNGGAHTLAPPSTGSGDALTMVIQVTNNGSAGAVTTSGFTKKTGDAFTTTNGDDFMLYISVVNGFSHLNVVALQ